MTNTSTAIGAEDFTDVQYLEQMANHYASSPVPEIRAHQKRLRAIAAALASAPAEQPAPSAGAHKACKPDMLVNGGALKLALNVLRRAGKNEVADELEATAQPSPTPQADSQPAAAEAMPPIADPKKCTAQVRCINGRITTESCTTKAPSISNGESSDGERDYYICPDCRKDIIIDYQEN